MLAREGIAISARALILVAGVAASVTGIVGVKRQREQELFLNKRIWELFRAERLEVPRRRRHPIPIFMLWIATLAAFIVVDVLAFVTEVC